MKFDQVYFVAGPFYMVDGSERAFIAFCSEADPHYCGDEFAEGPMAKYDYFVEAVVGGKAYTLNHVVRWWEGSAKVEELVARIEAKGQINLEHWSEGTCWDAYKTPLTWEEEKAKALENEAWDLGNELAHVC